MNINMTFSDLKVGMLVRLRCDSEQMLGMVMPDPCSKCGMCMVDEAGCWMSLDDFNEDFTYAHEDAYDIVEVRDISESPCYRLSLDARFHELLWIEPKSMTLEQIEQELGYRIKLVEPEVTAVVEKEDK